MGFLDGIRASKSQSNNKSKPPNNHFVAKDIVFNVDYLEKRFSDCSDIVFRKIKSNHKTNKDTIVLVFTDGLVEGMSINDGIIKQINLYSQIYNSKKINIDLLQNLLLVNEINRSNNFDEIIENILSGNTALFLEGSDEALILNTRGWESRAVEESSVESVIRGSKDAFVENIRTNTALIRRKLKDPNLKVKDLKVGSRSNTSIAVVYIGDITNQQLLNYVVNKLEEIEIDGIFDSGYIEQLLEENTYSLFPQMQVTERPDKVCANLLEGRMAILVDGSPDALILPIGFIQLFQSPGDYYERLVFANFVRLIRFFGFIIATTFPAIYVAITTFHQEILPTDFVLDIAKSRVEVPFPPIIEVLLMEGTIELLREASDRLPIKIGQTIGIVGAIVIGDAAVRANIVSPTMVVVIAITVIGSYIFPHFSTSYTMRFIRIPMILMAATFGAFGIIITWTWLIYHLCSLNSFGFAYLSPFAPSNLVDMKDAAIRAPLFGLKTRPIPTPKGKKSRK